MRVLDGVQRKLEEHKLAKAIKCTGSNPWIVCRYLKHFHCGGLTHRWKTKTGFSGDKPTAKRLYELGWRAVGQRPACPVCVESLREDGTMPDHAKKLDLAAELVRDADYTIKQGDAIAAILDALGPVVEAIESGGEMKTTPEGWTFGMKLKYADAKSLYAAVENLR